MNFENSGSQESSCLDFSEISEAYFLSFDNIDLEDMDRIALMFSDYSEQNEEYTWRSDPELTDTLIGLLEETDAKKFDVIHAYSLDGDRYNFFSTVSNQGLYVLGDGSVEETFQSIYEMADRRF